MPDNEDSINEESISLDKTEATINDSIQQEPTEDVAEQDEETYKEPVTIQPVKFSSFENDLQTSAEENSNLDILMDINLELTVELGRCELPVKKVLELTKGSIIELNKIAGESVDLFANGKHIANGEVVVIGDNFGLRIIGITSPEDRLKNL